VILPRNTFLSALRRFFARRGKVANIYSDSGSNFVGASRKFDHELVKATKENTMIAAQLEKDRSDWQFCPRQDLTSEVFGNLKLKGKG